MDNGSHFTNADRVLITKLDVKVERLISDMAELKNNYANRLDKLETEKVSKDDAKAMIDAALQGVKDDVSILKKLVYGCVGVILIAVIGAIVQLVVHKSL